jgi:hypothetical protein
LRQCPTKNGRLFQVWSPGENERFTSALLSSNVSFLPFGPKDAM